ncbi:xanthine dehydrogenase family protein molybdopterin-binding subunit [Commensalibacter oyaizuii]|uniref:Molybdopterin-dependent oxidoreductase n=1 Tax=Commensalibacter oyaizuii TaxID=3043873 RepID=A0ABT6Q007_9PROT|nr:molybdopterin cofactor-binding domain-containing protein [Commensalibacter sp. TBRC 16381]MDI2090455.1 molybdopterin-dependent oxidoreductase [Commensalibacter sp. TBRC 16381]
MMNKLSRRAFLTKTGALALGVSLPLFSTKAQQTDVSSEHIDNKVSDKPYHNAYIEISADNKVDFIIPDIEFGQGIYTAVAMLLAEELEVELAQVRVRPALPNKIYVLPGEITEITWGSGSTAKDWLPLQHAAATLRELLIQAAAQSWSVSADQCRAESGKIYGPEDQSVVYGSVLQQAVLLAVPEHVELKKKENYKLIGKSQPRVDTPEKIHGTAIYGLDVSVGNSDIPNMKVGLIVACPVVGGKIAQINDQQARSIKGVHDILKLDDALCVVADHFWAASKGVEQLQIVWDFGKNVNVTTESIYQDLHNAAQHQAIVGYTNSAEKIETALGRATQRHKWAYQQPMLAHAALEPLNCTVYIHDERCEIWSCSQTPLWVQEQVASTLDLKQDYITFHNLFVGGSFGRRLNHHYIIQAVQFAKQVAYPLKCIWSREEDFAQDCVRPPYLDQVEIGVDGFGQLTALKHHIIGPSVTEYWDKDLLTKEGMDPDLLLGLDTMPYQIPHYQLNYTNCPLSAIRPGWWQGNGATRNIFVLESLINSLASKAQKDPIEYRKSLKLDTRALAVIDMVEQHSQWDKELPRGVGRGFAMAHVFDSYIAMIVEAEVTAMSIVRLHRVIVAVDCGFAVNPDQIAAQIESGAVIGLGAALYDEIQIKNGQIMQHNYNQYRVLRMNECPQIEVHIINSDAPPSGVGELGTVVAAPALSHAIGSVIEKRLSSLPLNHYLT